MDGYSSYQNGAEKKDFNQLAVSIGSSIQKISQNVVSIKRMVNLIGTSQDSQELRTKLHHIQHYTNTLAKDTSASFNQLNKYVPEHREYKMQQERLVDDFSSALNAFQETQRLAVQKEKEEKNKRVEAGNIAPPSMAQLGYRQTGQLIELTPSGPSDSQAQIQARLQMEEDELRLIQEQEAAINQLEDNIRSVNEIFIEIGKMVHQQGEMVDSIEASVENAKSSVTEAATQLQQASHYKNKMVKCKCIMLIIPAVFLLCLIIILSWRN